MHSRDSLVWAFLVFVAAAAFSTGLLAAATANTSFDQPTPTNVCEVTR